MTYDEVKELYRKLSKILTKKEMSILNQMRQEMYGISDGLISLSYYESISDYRKNSIRDLHDKITKIPVFYGKDHIYLYGWEKKKSI